MESPHTQAAAVRRPRSLALGLVEAMTARIRGGQIHTGDKLPTEAAIMGEFGVSRTVVREALSKLQAGGLVETRHGVGTFVVDTGEAVNLRITPQQLASTHEALALLELRLGLETEGAGLAAMRRNDANLHAMRRAMAGFSGAIAGDGDAPAHDFQLHLEIARATQNAHFFELMSQLGSTIMGQGRLNLAKVAHQSRHQFLRREGAEHESIVDAIAGQDPQAARAAMRMHLANSRDRLRRLQEAAGD
jgi:GntR family transcriptional regulator, transcriptional repressor for pyruvate dehydrogenase complex